MKRIRSKLVFALLAIALLPVYPVYFLVKNLVQQSLEVGYNQNVETALSAATDISRELFVKYRQETLSRVAELKEAQLQRLSAKQRKELIAELEQTDSTAIRLSLYSKKELSWMVTNDPGVEFPEIYESHLAQISDKPKPDFIDGFGRTFIVAFNPISNQELVILTRQVDKKFTEGASTVIRINQIFKTLDFFEGELKRSFLLTFFAIYAPIALISVLVAIYFSRRLTKPLLEVASGTRKVAGGDWEYRIPVQSKDEVGQLASAFNQMVSTLKEKQEQLISLEKMAAWREIARILAHEIKNPLTPIQLMVQQMHDKYTGENAEYRKLLDESTEIVNDEIESLRSLVREFSEFARMPKLQLGVDNLNDVISELRKLYASDDITLNLGKVPEFSFDSEKMRRVLINLLENSVGSINEKGSGAIEISTELNDRLVVIKFSDTGNGMSLIFRRKTVAWVWAWQLLNE